MRDIFVSKGKSSDNPYINIRNLEQALENDPVYKAQFTGHDDGVRGGHGFNPDKAKLQYLYDLNTDPRNTVAIDYIRKINEDSDFAEEQGGKMTKLAKNFEKADPKGGYGISNPEQARALDRLKYKFWKRNYQDNEDGKRDGGGAYNSANDLDLVYQGMKSSMSGFSPMDDSSDDSSADTVEGYELSPELDAAINRNRAFEGKRVAGQIFEPVNYQRQNSQEQAESLVPTSAKSGNRENQFLFDYISNMKLG